MAFQPVPDTVELHIRGKLHGQRTENTLYFKSPVPVSQDVLDDIVDNVAAYINGPTVSDYWPNEFQFSEIYARDLSAPIAFQATNSSVSASVGGAGAGLPGNVTLVISMRSGLTGRSSRGRIYWMGLPESQVTGNTVTSIYANALVNILSDIISEVTELGLVHVVVSRVQNKVKLAVGLTYPVVDIVMANLDVDSQRRRLNGRGA